MTGLRKGLRAGKFESDNFTGPSAFRCFHKSNIFVIMKHMEYDIRYYSDGLREDILALPDTLAARYLVLTRRMVAVGPNLCEPHTKAMGNGLFELRLKGAEGIARVFYCTLVGKRIVMLHSFVKKSNRTPARELEVAMGRMKEVKNEHA